MSLNPDRLFPADPATRKIARTLYELVRDAPIVSPHGHTDPVWWGQNPAFSNAAELFVIPDHYVTRMLVSQGVPFAELGIGAPADPRAVWRRFADHAHLFLGTPSALWLEHAFETVFGLDQPLSSETADLYFDTITDALAQPGFRPRALYDRFGIEVIATTDSALDDLAQHDAVAASDWQGHVIPTYRPDAVTDPDHPAFLANLDRLAALTGQDTRNWQGYLQAHRDRRAAFIARGCTASDHGHPTAKTLDLTESAAQQLFADVLAGRGDAEAFRAQMLTEFARMSLDDGLVMQLHAGSRRNHHHQSFAALGPDRGFDIPQRTDFVRDLQPLLNMCGMDPRFRLILFTLDESTYARELAPLAGAYPCLRLGPPWWFHDSFEGIRRYREAVTETAGFWNTAGFNDDTRALCSIPARHDVARRCDSAYLAELVVTHRVRMEDAATLAPLLATGLARQAYNLDPR